MRELTKWPRLLVKGAPVTPEQADEILIRTCCPPYLSSNDRAWDETVRRILGFQSDDSHEIAELRDDRDKMLAWLKERWAFNDARNKALGILGLEYLYTSRITSSYIGGPHGWCDWNGTIFTNSYNIGKWPSTEEVTTEWTDIAEAFPFLDLTAQLITNEGGYDDHPGELAGEWRVKDGAVTYNPEPSAQIVPMPGEAEDEAKFKQFLTDVMLSMPGRGRGVSPERLERAVRRVEQRMGDLHGPEL